MPTVKIEGMKCQHCVGSVKKVLETFDGVENVQVDLGRGEAYFEGTVDLDKLKKAIADKGFEVVA